MVVRILLWLELDCEVVVLGEDGGGCWCWVCDIVFRAYGVMILNGGGARFVNSVCVAWIERGRDDDHTLLKV